MAKKILIFLLFCFFFINPKPSFSIWIRYENSPIIPNKVDKKELINGARGPTILREDGLIKMWFMTFYQNKWSLDYIYSSDGINWYKPYSKPVLIPQTDEDHISSPTIIKENNIYKLWYSTYLYSNGKYHIKYATSTNGVDWNVVPSPVLSGELSWEFNGVLSPYVLKKDNTYFMWYTAWGSTFQISLATSIDGINWNKKDKPIYLQDNILHAGNHNLKIIDDKFHLWFLTGNSVIERIYRYQSTDGYQWTGNFDDCLVLEKNEKNFPNQVLNDSDTIIFNDNIYLYFSGIHDGTWQIGLVTEKPINSTPTPTPQPKIILIPGLFASWNKEALLHNKEVNFDQWKLPNFVHEYDGLINTLKNLGFQKNEDFFIFTYDWRQPIEKTVEDLNKFLTNNQSSIPNINLIGHSLGGLVARIFTQKYPEKVNNIISVGSPHQGAIQVYKPLSAGEIDRENTFMWLAQKLILLLNKENFETDRETLQKKFPVAFDLLPLFDFLKKEDGQVISTNSMTLKNPTLPKFNSSFPQIYPRFTAIYAHGVDTPKYYTIQSPTALDSLLGNYKDGRPTSLIKDGGDGTVLAESAYEKGDSDPSPFENFNHGEIIYKTKAIKKILDIFNIDYNEKDVVEGKRTVIAPSLIFLIHSPATMEAVDPNKNHYFEEDGIIFIEDAPSGTYQLLVKGKEKGRYQVIIGQIAENNDIWETIDGSITSDQPEKEVDQYQINFSSQSATCQFPTPPSTTPTPTPTTSTVNSSNSTSQSTSNNNQQTNSNQSSDSISSNPTPTPTQKLLSINRSIPEENIANTINNQPQPETNKNVLGEKTKNNFQSKNSLSFLLMLIGILLTLILTVIFLKKELIFRLLKKTVNRILERFPCGR